MSLRLRLLFMLSTFLILVAVFAGGALIIFEKMSKNMSDIYTASNHHRIVMELEDSLRDFVSIVTNWGNTGIATYRNQYREKRGNVYKSFGEASDVLKDSEELTFIGNKFETIMAYAQEVMDQKYPLDDSDVPDYLRKLDEENKLILEKLNMVHDRSMTVVINTAVVSEEIKRNMIFYLFILIAFSTMMAVYLVIVIRRAITGPFSELLTATERIGGGDLSYRVRMNRTDEFGIIGDRIDDMMDELASSQQKLQKKLDETELFSEVSRIAGTTFDLKDALGLIAGTVASKLGHDYCDVYMLRAEIKAFVLEATNEMIEKAHDMGISLESSFASRLTSTLSHVIIEDTTKEKGDKLVLSHPYRSLLAVPIIRENTCSGILTIGDARPDVFSDEDIVTLKIVAHTIGSVIRNAELFLSTKKQLEELTVLYELTKAVTSVLDLDELLKRIVEEISRLLSSKGCIIRLLEEHKLKIRSHFGVPKGFEKDMELDIGSGIAGWVAQKGRPLLVEDASVMPVAMRVPVLDVTSVICVPMIVGEAIIGTISLYDKYDSSGNVIAYTIDDLKTVEGFASISAIAIEQSKIYAQEVIRKRLADKEKKRLDILFNSVQGGIITLDRDFMITSVNKYIEDWLDIPVEELIGHSSFDIFHDKIGICPHCASKATFDTGEINSIMQSRGVNYAELTAYPIKSGQGEINECVVFVMDVTERILYQEETLSLYREVTQTKEFMESIIEHSADAIVTSDTQGIITSWNQGAEKIYGFTASESVGKYLPFLPEFLMEKEKENIQRIVKGEVLKDIETVRKKKDGAIIEVSLTLSPIKDAAGEVIGISGISRDISEKKRFEKELIRRDQELSRLFFISSAMRSTLELDKLLRMVLTAVTMSDGMGFNRSILFLIDEGKNVLRGAMGVGPASPEEAWKIWDDISLKQKTLDGIMHDIVTSPPEKDSFFDKLSLGIEIPLEEDTILTRSVREKNSYNIKDVKEEPLSDSVLTQQLGTQAYAVVPLISRDKVIGLIWVDNDFTRKPIIDDDIKFLISFSNHIASAIESARLFEQVAMAEQQLENIFESMSDMVYFNTKDYVIKSVNKAVCDKLKLPQSEIVGKKCYEVFHGTDEPFEKCPHYKTVSTKQAYIEELEDKHMGGTFLTSSSPILDPNGEFIGSVHVVRDITELKNLQEKLTIAEKMAALGEVAAKVAHEIRNPLVSVGGFAKRLEMKLDGNLQEYAKIIVKEVDRLEDILKEILGFVREMRLAKEVINLNELVDDILTLMKSDIEERGIELVKEFSAPTFVFVDPNRMKEAIVNIMSNAIQSLKGVGSIYVKTLTNEKFAVVEIQDTGAGISEEVMPSIFDPFFTTKATGTGLGLAITNKIIQEHSGRIEIDSQKGKGTTFRVYIPIKEG